MDPVTGLSLGRIAVGVAAFVRPDLVGDAVGVDTRTNPQAPFSTRLFATRDVALGALTLAATGTARRQLLVAGVAVDLADAAAAVLGITGQRVPARRAAMLLGPALGAAAIGFLGVRGRA